MNLMQLKLAVRYLTRRKLRTALTTLAITIGVMILFGMNAILSVDAEAFRRNMQAATGQVDVSVSVTGDGMFDASAVDAVRGVAGIASATGSLRRPLQMPRESTVALITVVGLDPATAQAVRRYDLVEGRFLEQGDEAVIVISDRFAEQAGVALGDTLTLPASTGSLELEIVGLLRSPGLPGAEEVQIPLATAQRLFNQADNITVVEAVFAPGVDPEAVRAAVDERLGGAFRVGQPEEVGGVTAEQLISILFGFMGAAALLMGGFIIFITFRTVVVERRRDIGMLRAIGATRRTVIGAILAETALQGAVGTVIGLAFGFAMALIWVNFQRPYYQEALRIDNPTPSITVANLGISIALGIGVTVVSGLLPALAASRVTPLAALRPALPEAHSRAAGRGALAGAALMILSALPLALGNTDLLAPAFFGFIVGLIMVTPAIIKPIAAVFGGLLSLVFAGEGRIAQGNLTRQPGRATVTASVMMIGLAILVAMFGLVSSITNGFQKFVDASLGADFMVMPQVLGQGNVGAAPDLADQIKAIDGVQAISSLRITGTVFNDQPLQVIGVDPRTYSQISGLDFTAGEPDAAFASLDDGRTAIVNFYFASQAGIELDDTLTLPTPEGDQDYRVVGIGTDYINSGSATAYISQANLADDFHQTNDAMILVEAESEADPASVRADLMALLADYPAFTLFSFQEFQDVYVKAGTDAFYIMYGLGVMLAIPSLIALMNTQLINVIERIREIGLIRAVGATKRQIRRLVLAETLLLAATGTAFGTLAGVGLSYIAVNGWRAAGFNVSFFFPGVGLLAATAVGMMFGVLGALIPAGQAARVPIVQALRYE